MPALAPENRTGCPACGTLFLACVEHAPCPGCGRPAEDVDEIVADALRAYETNHRLHGRAIPPVIRVQGLRDDYLYRALFFFRALDDRGPRESEGAVLARTLASLSPATEPPWRAHLEAFYRELLRARRQASGREK